MSSVTWDEISFFVSREYPALKTEVVQVGECSCRYFILPDGFKDIGRSLVFGFVRGENESSLSDLLFKLESIARNHGLLKIVGPLNFSTFFDYRIPTDHFELPSYPGEPSKNKSLLMALQSNLYTPLKNYYSHDMKVHWNPRFFVFVKIFGAIGAFLSRKHWKFVSLSQYNYNSHLPELYELTHGIFSANFLYQKIPFEAFQIFFEKQILPHIDESACILAVSPQGKLLGFSLSLKDPTHPRRLLFKTIGVRRGEAKGPLLGRQLMRAVYLAARKSYDTCFACLMIEGNPPDRLLRKYKLNYFTQSYALFVKELVADRGSL